MLTFSTRKELRHIAEKFLRPVSEFVPESNLEKDLFASFIEKYGDRRVVVSSAPGRVNLMGRHIEHRGGSVNMMCVSKRLVFVASRRDDDIVNIANLDETYPAASFRISDFVSTPLSQSGEIENSAQWVDFLSSEKAKNDILQNKGHWANYVKSAVFRFQMATDLPLCGMDILAAGDIPVAAGLSSSSAVVVATAEAVVALNALNIPVREFVDLCGEGEWYVGSRGGAGDHAAMKCSHKGFVTHLKFKPFEIGERYPFFKDCSIIVVNSGEKAKKSEGALKIFNERISSYEKAFSQVREAFPEMPLANFRDIAFLPAEDRIRALNTVEDSVRGVALFGVNECRRAEDCLEILKNNDPAAMGEMMKSSHDGDRLGGGQYECSTALIDSICDELNGIEGVYGSQIVGAGLGGCVIALVKDAVALSIVERFQKKGFDSFVCESGEGSSIKY
jgi:N-acetylgalactosamine kinase